MHSKQTSIIVEGSSVVVWPLDSQRVKVSHEDGRTWIVALSRQDMSVEVARRDGDPADVDRPDWLFPLLADLASPEAA